MGVVEGERAGAGRPGGSGHAGCPSHTGCSSHSCCSSHAGCPGLADHTRATRGSGGTLGACRAGKADRTHGSSRPGGAGRAVASRWSLGSEQGHTCRPARGDLGAEQHAETGIQIVVPEVSSVGGGGIGGTAEDGVAGRASGSRGSGGPGGSGGSSGTGGSGSPDGSGGPGGSSGTGGPGGPNGSGGPGGSGGSGGASGSRWAGGPGGSNHRGRGPGPVDVGQDLAPGGLGGQIQGLALELHHRDLVLGAGEVAGKGAHDLPGVLGCQGRHQADVGGQVIAVHDQAQGEGGGVPDAIRDGGLPRAADIHGIQAIDHGHRNRAGPGIPDNVARRVQQLEAE